MPTGQARPSQIRPVDLVGPINPVVTQPAVDALTEAFRKGSITVEEILSRKQQRDQQRAVFEEQFSPENVRARSAQTALETAKAEAGLPLVEPTAQLAQTELETKQAELKYGPGIKLFQTLGPEAGIIDQPLLANGKPDYAKQAEIGLQLAAQKLRKTNAIERLKVSSGNMREGIDAAGNKILIKINDFGEHITPELESELRKQAATPLSIESIQPGTAVTTTTTTPVTTTGAPQTTTAAPVTTTAAPAPATVTPGQTIPGQGMVIGVAQTSSQKAPTEAQQRAQLALSRFAQTNDMLGALQESGFDPTTTTSWIDSMLPEVLKSGDRKSYDAAVSAWSQGLLRLESGAAIAPREKTWYDKSFFPQVNDPPAVVQQKAELRKGIEKMVAEMAQAGGVISPQSAEQTKRIYDQANQLSASGGGAVERRTLPSGAVMVRGANGVWKLEKAPTNLAPPKSRPVNRFVEPSQAGPLVEPVSGRLSATL